MATTTSNNIKSLHEKLRVDSGSFQQLQQELQANIEARKTFTQQATENEMVLEELKSLEEGANVYKLIGPMLAKQDVVEATSNVTKRLEFINAERLVKRFVDFSRSRSFCFSTRLEKAAEAIEKKFDQTQRDIQILQQRIAQLSTGAAAGGGGAMLDTA
ncbi:prefoldin subunit 6 [Bathycoccus prasinos]|uniref:Prefoldin subunit 6 n=1 Tax=Bathycoccus prasinos TaxID=41875 RepID=K8EAF6_9CHLO|nr:prefoldin subunit 6 [Bathycoccus prasinos]CCO14689.1 prefoldin subunit 6 [Bathycoccus prasinos]|eukprot:XP_007515810.1 prefoldin subunit 6 [Bathycoccus prasinos]